LCDETTQAATTPPEGVNFDEGESHELEA
jgi:hypothetical protein